MGSLAGAVELGMGAGKLPFAGCQVVGQAHHLRRAGVQLQAYRGHRLVGGRELTPGLGQGNVPLVQIGAGLHQLRADRDHLRADRHHLATGLGEFLLAALQRRRGVLQGSLPGREVLLEPGLLSGQRGHLGARLAQVAGGLLQLGADAVEQFVTRGQVSGQALHIRGTTGHVAPGSHQLGGQSLPFLALAADQGLGSVCAFLGGS